MSVTPVKGTVKFYREEKGWGFFVSDAGEEVFFHRSNGGGVTETDGKPGHLEFAWHMDIDRNPEKGDRVAFLLGQSNKGLKATNWTFEAMWDLAVRIVAARKKPDDYYCHIVDTRKLSPSQNPCFLWDGWMSELEAYLKSSGLDLLSNKDLMLEARMGHGWEEIGKDPKIGYVMSERELMDGLQRLAPPDGRDRPSV